MKLTDKDNKMFETLHSSSLGSDINDYLERLITYTCDVRNLGDIDTKSAIIAANVIQKNLIDKIKLRTKMVANDPEGAGGYE